MSGYEYEYQIDANVKKHENILKVIARVCLGLGVLSFLFLFFTSAIVWEYDYSESIKGIDSISWGGVIVSFSVLLSSIISWSMINIIIGISYNTREIKNKK